MVSGFIVNQSGHNLIPCQDVRIFVCFHVIFRLKPNITRKITKVHEYLNIPMGSDLVAAREKLARAAAFKKHTRVLYRYQRLHCIQRAIFVNIECLILDGAFCLSSNRTDGTNQ